jgi:acyl-CoA-binding protein
VFLIKEGPFSFDQWRKLSLKKSQEQTEKEERELFEKLKSKFEKK